MGASRWLFHRIVANRRTACRIAAVFAVNQEIPVKRIFPILALLLSSLPALAQNNAAAQADVIRPGDNLVLENIPAIPAGIAERAFQYGEVRSAALEDWDGSRREMLIVTR